MYFSVSAHPHMLILPSLEFEVKDGKCPGVWVDWEFDTMFSLSIIDSYDWDRNGIFDEEETRSIHDYAFINLENYGYFISVREGDVRRSPGGTYDFSARQEDGRLFYRFYVSFAQWNLGPDFAVSVFDPTYFCAVRYRDIPITLRKLGPGPVPEYGLEENREYPVYYDPLGAADDTTLYTRWKPGLETAYPEEAHVSF